jgi:hypothetical protein
MLHSVVFFLGTLNQKGKSPISFFVAFHRSLCIFLSVRLSLSAHESARQPLDGFP